MQHRVRLNTYVIQILEQFGELSYVANKAIHEMLERDILPTEQVYVDESKRVMLTITTPLYDEYVQSQGIHSNTISISRMLQHFVDNELYVDFNWTAKYNVENTTFQTKFDRVFTNVMSLKNIVPRQYRTEYTNIITLFKEINDDICKRLIEDSSPN